MDIPPSALIPSAPLSFPFTYWSKEWGDLPIDYEEEEGGREEGSFFF